MKLRGFTLIELIVVMGILAILATIVVIAVNPARQFSSSRNAKRASDTRAIAQAINQHAADNNGIVYSGITTTAQVVGTGAGKLDLTSILVPNYLSAIPADPQGNAADTKYAVYKNANGAVGVSATLTEMKGTIVAGESGNLALKFDGTNDCVTLSANKSLPAGTQYTYEVIFKMDGPNADPSGAYDSLMGLAHNVWGIRFEAGTLTDGYVHTYPAATYFNGFNVGDGNWHHIAVVWNSSASWVRIFVDGVMRGSVGTTLNATPDISGATRWYLGCGGSGIRFIEASIDAIRLSTTARYSSAFTPPTTLDNDSNTVGLWNFNEGAGSVIRDDSSVGNNGTIPDTQTWIAR